MKITNLLIGLSLLIVLGCSKDNDSDQEPGGNKLTALVPQAYLNEAKEMGFEIHAGDNPPDVVGEYLLAPWRFDKDNYNSVGVGTPPGSTNENGFTLRLSEQKGTSLVVRYVGYYEGTKELSKPFIIGSGNSFTICRHIQMVGGSGANFSFPYVQLISGSKDGETLRNVKMATIGLKADSPNEAGITVEGQISIRSDADGISQ